MTDQIDNFILTASHPADEKMMGGKAAALAVLTAAGFPIPAWFVISAAAFELSPDLADVSIRQAIASAVDELSDGKLLAVRSSAVDEDGSDHSFAGQLESFLCVPTEWVADRVRQVWQSGFTDRVFRYRAENGIGAIPTAPAVLVQRMVDADISGVAFSADPITGGRSTVVISAVLGLGTALVGGDGDCDTYRLDHAGALIEQKIVRKSIRHVPDPSASGGYSVVEVADAIADEPALSIDQLQRITRLVLDVSRFRGRPQDIEWAIKDNQLFLLQARPITSLNQLADADGVRTIWDNSNIAESYSGITTPLTFSFARHAYQGAYRQFCRLMKVPARVIEENDAIFMQMLGLIRGRVYYNLLNWYRLLAMLPGYSVNHKFMEQMMGVRERIPADASINASTQSGGQRAMAVARLLLSAGGLVRHHFVLNRTIRAFYDRLNTAMAPPNPPLAEMRLDQLIREFRKLEAQLITRWDAPLINDFLAMIFFGTLGKLCKKWCPVASENLQNDLIGDEGGIISLEPARRISAMAKQIVSDQELVDSLCDDDRADAEQKLLADAELAKAYRDYLEQFGDRCLEELKLESATLVDDPMPLLRSIGHTARRLCDESTAPKPFRPREAAEKQVRDAMRKHPLKRSVFNWVLKNARGRVRDRENLRFERTRLFGRVRRIFIEVGQRFYAEGLLENDRDVFYLTIEEALGYVEGTCVLENLRELTTLRKRQFEGYATQPPPAERFETRGAIYLGNQFRSIAKSNPANVEGDLKGIGCCPGIVRGPVRVIRDPRGAEIQHGEILVAERTDPGWIMLFPSAAGVLVERGSLLSHSAIVAREMGIPAVVSIPGLMQSLVDGQWVEMDGSLGTIRKISEGETT